MCFPTLLIIIVIIIIFIIIIIVNYLTAIVIIVIMIHKDDSSHQVSPLEHPHEVYFKIKSNGLLSKQQSLCSWVWICFGPNSEHFGTSCKARVKISYEMGSNHIYAQEHLLYYYYHLSLLYRWKLPWNTMFCLATWAGNLA